MVLYYVLYPVSHYRFWDFCYFEPCIWLRIARVIFLVFYCFLGFQFTCILKFRNYISRYWFVRTDKCELRKYNFMKKNTTLLKPDTIYHIYNRGIDKCDIFFEEQNYDYFLMKYQYFLFPVVETYAYCLINNHFHFLIKTKSEKELIRKYKLCRKPLEETERLLGQRLGRSFANFFNCYAQAFNKRFDRTGGLFETPFRRVAVNDDIYFLTLLFYIHSNPIKHELTDDFESYPFSSYGEYVKNSPSFLERDTVLEYFDDIAKFVKEHEKFIQRRSLGG